MHTRAVQNAFFARLNFAEFAGMTALLVMGFLIVQGGTGTIGGATAAMLLFLRLFDPINQLLFVVDQLQSALASLARISGVIGDDQGGTTAASETPAPTAGLRLRGIGHAYTSGHAVLAEIDVAVAPGETVAVVGATGAGKSTLAAIAAGVQSPTCGRVDMPAGTVLVTQEVHVFSTTLRDNLTLAKADASDAELRSALDAVGLALVPDRLPDGLDTRLHPDTLTAAEVQQLALARVLLVDPPAVILDEATAESGSSDASRLEEAAKRVIAGRTALVVAHRLNQAEAADRVIVMSSGRTIEEGTHTELLAANGSYARLWEAWRNHRD
jgi:ATP-binding cassette subfamily C protein